MSNKNYSKIWKKWYPNELVLNPSLERMVKKTKFLHERLQNSPVKDISLQSDVKLRDENLVHISKKPIEICKKQLHKDIEFKKNLEEISNLKLTLHKEISRIQKDKKKFNQIIEKFLLDFKLSLESLNHSIESRLVKLILKIVKKIIENHSPISENNLLFNIQKCLSEDLIMFKNLALHIHSKNRALIENHFKEVFSSYGWIIVNDNNIDKNGCKIFFPDGRIIDTSLSSRWEEFCQLVFSDREL